MLQSQSFSALFIDDNAPSMECAVRLRCAAADCRRAVHSDRGEFLLVLPGAGETDCRPAGSLSSAFVYAPSLSYALDEPCQPSFCFLCL